MHERAGENYGLLMLWHRSHLRVVYVANRDL